MLVNPMADGALPVRLLLDAASLDSAVRNRILGVVLPKMLFLCESRLDEEVTKAMWLAIVPEMT